MAKKPFSIVAKTSMDPIPPIKWEKNFAEFFAGIGLMRIGLEKSGWKATFANDIAEDKFRIYKNHFKNWEHFLLQDIHKITAETVPTVALATASFPCNDLSLAGLRKGLAGKQSSAYWGFIRILEEMDYRRPLIVLLENVLGFLTSHGGRDFQAALLALNRLGYIVDPFIIDAINFVPQSRARLFVVGVKKDGHAKWEVCDRRHFYESELRPKALAQFIFGHPEIVWNLRQLPKLPTQKKSISDILDDLKDDSPFWWSDARTNYLFNQMSKKHAALLDEMKKKKKWSYGTIFRRIRNGKSMAELRTDGIAGCLRTPRGGSGRQILVKAGYGRACARLLTPSECSKLMGADDFTIPSTLNQALFGFGDAVCVPVIEWIAAHYLNPVFNNLVPA